MNIRILIEDICIFLNLLFSLNYTNQMQTFWQFYTLSLKRYSDQLKIITKKIIQYVKCNEYWFAFRNFTTFRDFWFTVNQRTWFGTRKFRIPLKYRFFEYRNGSQKKSSSLTSALKYAHFYSFNSIVQCPFINVNVNSKIPRRFLCIWKCRWTCKNLH